MSVMASTQTNVNGMPTNHGVPRKRWLIIQPKSNTPLMVDSGKVSMPLNLLMVATIAQRSFDVDFIDERIGDVVPQDLSAYDVVAITARTLNVNKAYVLADRALAQGRRVILGGVHPTMMIDEALQHCTSVVVGEIESIWHELERDIQRDQLKRVYRAERFEPMNHMVHPDFDIITRSKHASRYSNRLPILATKGCPVGCSFCCAPKVYGKVYRTREVDYIIDEMKYHQQRNGRADVHFSFMDDNIAFRPAFMEELLNEMIHLGVRWNSNISMNFLEKPHIPELARASGCELLSVGFESVSPETIKYVGKGSNRIHRYGMVVENTHKQGIALQGYFIFGFDTDTEQSFQDTYDFIMQNRIEFPVFTIATPFPGTDWFEEMKHRVVHFNWDKYDTFHYMYQPARLEQERFLKNFLKIQREVYSLKGIYQRMRGRSLDWVWGVNLAMHHFIYQLKPEMLI
ncbi:MAG: B12-binding domain-containing radical SAM protein [Chloroflexaceae bacterium]|nr:B12-binding domain-containing radical SAM protein [Chloroflexaceae bacterium]